MADPPLERRTVYNETSEGFLPLVYVYSGVLFRPAPVFSLFLFCSAVFCSAVQPVDFTTLTALAVELRTGWLPARLEQVYQGDRHTLYLSLRTLDRRGWLRISWHPQAAHLCIADPPPRTPDTFTFSQQLRHQLNGLVLVAIAPLAAWERVLDLQFARRPGEAPLWHLYAEVMGKYSNVILANQDHTILTAAHQVSPQQSSVRPILTGQPYEVPPVLTEAVPDRTESLEHWRDRLCLIPGKLQRNFLKSYRGLSSALVQSLLQVAELDVDVTSDRLQAADWQRLFQQWQEWLEALATEDFHPGWTAQGYTVVGWGSLESVATVQELVHRYYQDHLNRQTLLQLHHALNQKLGSLLQKLTLKLAGFRDRLDQSDQADQSRQQADLLMAHLHLWRSGMTEIIVPDFETGEAVTLPLNPEKTGVQIAQGLYKRHQKLKRTRAAIAPLMAAVEAEIHYLQQVEASLGELTDYTTANDLETLQEIREELIQQGYLADPEYRGRRDASASDQTSQPLHYRTPNGLEVWVGRNNRQNDHLTFRRAADADLWFHTQEIPGSHVLMRLPAGAIADQVDCQYAADLAAFHSRARHSDQVPVIYTPSRHVYKPKGAKPGMTVYKNETVIWGKPARGKGFNLDPEKYVTKL